MYMDCTVLFLRSGNRFVEEMLSIVVEHLLQNVACAVKSFFGRKWFACVLMSGAVGALTGGHAVPGKASSGAGSLHGGVGSTA